MDATWEEDPVKQKELFDKVNQDTIQPHLEKVEQHLVKNGSGYLVGQGVSSVDLFCQLCSFYAELFLLI